MNDRLEELPSWVVVEEDDLEKQTKNIKTPTTSKKRHRFRRWKRKGRHENLGTVEMATPQPKHMKHFFREVEVIKEGIETVKRATKKVGDFREMSLQATTTEQETTLSRQLRLLVDQTNQTAKKTKNSLALLKEDTESLEKKEEIKHSDLRIREGLYHGLTRQFIIEMKVYQDAQQTYKTDMKKKVTRQVQIVKPNVTEEEVDTIMRSKDGSEALFRERILMGRVADDVKLSYDRVAGKYQDILTLERSLAELHQMFLDAALLTEEQGEQLDRIELHVKEANDFVEGGNVQVAKSLWYQKMVRKKQGWIILIVVVATMVLLLPLLL